MLYRADVETYIATGSATPDLLQWPHDLGAPVLDGDGVPDNYNLAGGDQPAIWGDQTLWWVMNDVGNDHMASDTLPIGLEVQVTAFGLAHGPDALTHATFYRYRLINRSTQALDSAYVGIYSDPDLGDASDDYVGTDLAHELGYVYNADNADGNGVPPTYGTPPPALGVQFLGTPAGLANGRDDDGDGSTDEAGEQLGLTASSCWAKSHGFPLREPANALERYNCLKGLWIDGTPMTEGGNGYQSAGPVTTFQFTGDPVTATYWSELCPNAPCGPDLAPGDRRMGHATGPFTLAAGGEQTLEFAILFGQGTDHRNSVAALRDAAVLSRSAYDSGTFEPHPVAVGGGPPAAGAIAVQRAAPNPFADGTTLRYTLSRPANIRVAVLDVLGREVLVVSDGPATAGVHALAIGGRALEAGVYAVRFWVDGVPAATIPVTVAR